MIKGIDGYNYLCVFIYDPVPYGTPLLLRWGGCEAGGVVFSNNVNVILIFYTSY
jgi:hypothetical protein